MIGTRVLGLELVRDKGQWFIDATESPEQHESFDVDLGFSPAKAELTVDDLGLVIDYQGIWTRGAEAGSPSPVPRPTG